MPWAVAPTARAWALLVVAAVNIAALLPVWLGLWSVFALVGLYWFENLVLGVIQFLKLRAVERIRPQPEAYALSGFFAVHYGLFTAVHGILVLVFFGFLLEGAHTGGASFWWLSAAAVTLMLALGYRREYIIGDAARRADPSRLMFEPYTRVIVLHLVVLIGAWLALTMQAPRALLLLLIGLKLAVELATAWIATRHPAAHV